MRENPIATLLAVISAVMLLVSRLNRHLWWGDPLFIAGIAVLVIGGAMVLLAKR